MAPGQVSDQCQIVLGANLANLGPHPFGRTLWKRGVQYATKHMRISCWGPVWGRFRSTFILLAKSQGRSQYVVHFRDDACSEADPASASKHERPVRGDAPDGTAVAGGFRSLVLIWLSACMFWLRFTKTTAGVSRYLPLGHSECGFPAIVSLCRPKGPANLVGMLNMSHIVGSRAHRISAASHCTSAAFLRPSHFRKLRTTGLQMSSYVSSDAWILCKAMSSF